MLNKIYSKLTSIFTLLFIYFVHPLFKSLETYSDMVKTGVFDDVIDIDYQDAIYTNKQMNARLLYIIDMMNSEPAKTTIVRGFDKTMQLDIIYTHATKIESTTAGAEIELTLESSSQKDQVTVNSGIEMNFTPDAGYTNYCYVSVKEGLDSDKVKVKPINPALIIGKSAAADIPLSTMLNITGPAYEQGSSSVKPVSSFPTVIENYTQIQRTGYEYSKSAGKENLYVKGTLKNMLMEDARRDHLLKMEKTLLFNGPKYKKTIAASTESLQFGYMEGLIYTIKQNSTNATSFATGAWGYDTFDNWQFTLFDPDLDDAIQKRLLVVNKATRKFFYDLKKDKICVKEIEPVGKEVYGIPQISKVLTDAGEFDMMVHPRVHARFPSMTDPFGLALHLSYIQYKPYESVHMETNIQARDVHGRKDEFICEWTYLLHQPVYHGIFYVVE